MWSPRRGLRLNPGRPSPPVIPVTHPPPPRAESFNYCSVPLEDQDSILFLALAVLFTAGLSGKLALTGVLVAGGVLGVVNYYVNLGHLGNAVSIWLGIQPPDLFLYVFLPPLLADAALRIRFSLFRKVGRGFGSWGCSGCIPSTVGTCTKHPIGSGSARCPPLGDPPVEPKLPFPYQPGRAQHRHPGLRHGHPERAGADPLCPARPGLCWAGHGLGPWGSVCRHAGTHRRRLGVRPAESRCGPGEG